MLFGKICPPDIFCWREKCTVTWIFFYAGWSMECLKDWGKFIKYALPGSMMIFLDLFMAEVGMFLSGKQILFLQALRSLRSSGVLRALTLTSNVFFLTSSWFAKRRLNKVLYPESILVCKIAFLLYHLHYTKVERSFRVQLYPQWIPSDLNQSLLPGILGEYELGAMSVIHQITAVTYQVGSDT